MRCLITGLPDAPRKGVGRRAAKMMPRPIQMALDDRNLAYRAPILRPPAGGRSDT